MSVCAVAFVVSGSPSANVHRCFSVMVRVSVLVCGSISHRIGSLVGVDMAPESHIDRVVKEEFFQTRAFSVTVFHLENIAEQSNPILGTLFRRT